jgi:hypothetical protein
MAQRNVSSLEDEIVKLNLISLAALCVCGTAFAAPTQYKCVVFADVSTPTTKERLQILETNVIVRANGPVVVIGKNNERGQLRISDQKDPDLGVSYRVIAFKSSALGIEEVQGRGDAQSRVLATGYKTKTHSSESDVRVMCIGN